MNASMMTIKPLMRTTIDVPESLLRRAKAEAALRGLRLKDIVRDALEHHLAVSPLPDPSGPVAVEAQEPSILADVNVWFATLVAEHPHHAAATRWWRSDVLPAGHDVALCRLTRLGLLRPLSNRRVMGPQRMDHGQAWENVHLLDEPAGVDRQLAGWCARGRSSPGFWSDACLAVFALAGGHRFATFDRGFLRFDGLHVLLLGAADDAWDTGPR